MNLHDWIKWAFRPADTPHRFASYVLARQASRDLGTEATTEQFEAAMPFAVHHRNHRGSAYYLAADTTAKRTYDFRRYVLAEPIGHPLDEDDHAPFATLPPDDQAAVLAWIKASLVPIRRTRTVPELRYPCALLTGRKIRDQHMRGALLAAGIEAAGHRRFRCCLSDKAMADLRRKRREQRQEIQP
jgi:hypothetical protein